MKVLSVVGARPQFVKLAPVAQAMKDASVEHVIVHTGQHYDPSMSDVFFENLNIPLPNIHLNCGSATHGVQTGAMLSAMDGVLERDRPDWVLVYGDTNSTLAGALAAVKMHIPVAHLEAGLRSFNRKMPEEHNRVLTDHAADLCLAPTEIAMNHLFDEGLSERSVFTGDVMTDVCLNVAMRTDIPVHAAAPNGPYALATIHRAENTDDSSRLAAIVEALVAFDRPVLLPVHPRLRERARSFGISLDRGALKPIEPLDYPRMIHALKDASLVITDSGGLQKEAFLLRTPCVTMRTETEWRETIDLGWNALCPDPHDLNVVVSQVTATPTDVAPYGEGHAAQNVVQALLSKWMR